MFSATVPVDPTQLCPDIVNHDSYLSFLEAV